MTFVGWELSAWLVTFWSDWVVDLTFLTLTRGKLPEARKLEGTFHCGNADLLDNNGICRAIANHLAGGISTLAFRAGILVFAAAPAGIAALRGHHRCWAHEDETRAGFGWMANRLEMFASIILGWITGHLVVVASLFSPTARPNHAWSSNYVAARTLPITLHAWPAATFVSDLSMEISEPRSTEGRRLPWFGPGSSPD
jgi:cobalamin biosynthesis protein CobD/CbiB